MKFDDDTLVLLRNLHSLHSGSDIIRISENTCLQPLDTCSANSLPKFLVSALWNHKVMIIIEIHNYD